MKITLAHVVTAVVFAALLAASTPSAAVGQIRMMTSAELKASNTRPSYSASSAIQTALSSNATGIYLVGTSAFATRKSAATYALVHNGQIRQVHSKSNGAWMPKRTGSSGGVPITAVTFDTLSAIAGGLNRNVNTLPAATRDKFLSMAGLAGSGGSTGSLPREVPPVNGTCPSNYQIKLLANPKRMACVLIAHDMNLPARSDSLVAAAGIGLLELLVPPALASLAGCGPLGCMAYFSFGEISAFRFVFQYDPGSGFWGFNGFGIVAVFLLPEPEPEPQAGTGG